MIKKATELAYPSREPVGLAQTQRLQKSVVCTLFVWANLGLVAAILGLFAARYLPQPASPDGGGCRPMLRWRKAQAKNQ